MKNYKPKHKHHIIPDTYNIPVHNQGALNNCSSHAVATQIEYQLSERFKERTLVDVDDLWEKQKKIGTATEEGDYVDGPYEIIEKYGALFTTNSGKRGVYYMNGKIEW